MTRKTFSLEFVQALINRGFEDMQIVLTYEEKWGYIVGILPSQGDRSTNHMAMVYTSLDEKEALSAYQATVDSFKTIRVGIQAYVTNLLINK